MAEHCKNCGAELFTDQRFCRACGASTDYESEGAPTQMMPPAPPDLWGPQGAQTAPTQQAPTNPVFTPPVYYQPTIPPAPATPPAYAPQERSRKTWIPILVLIAVLVFGGAIYGGRILIREIRAVVASFNDSVEIPDTQIVPLNKGAAVSVRGFNGSISVDVWDKQEAEIKTVRRGASDEAARAIPITMDANENSLVIEAQEQEKNTGVSYQIKLPRELGAVKINTTNGSIKISDIAGIIEVQTTNSSIVLSDVSGIAKAQTSNGSIKGEINSIAPNQPVSFTTTNSSINIEFQSDINADLTASTTNSSIRIDGDEFPEVKVTKQRGAQQASGRIGNGGQPLTITTTNSSIRISR